MRTVGRWTTSAVRRGIFVDYDAHKTPSPVRGGIFERPERAMSLLRSFILYVAGFYKYVAPNGAKRRTRRTRLCAIGRFRSLSLASARFVVGRPVGEDGGWKVAKEHRTSKARCGKHSNWFKSLRLRSPSPRPSPPGRGRNDGRRGCNRIVLVLPTSLPLIRNYFYD